MFEPFARAVQRANQVLSEQGKAAKKAASDVAASEKQKTKAAEQAAKEQVAAWKAADKNLANARKTGDKEAVAETRKTEREITDIKRDEEKRRVEDEKRAEREMSNVRKWASAEEKKEARERAQMAKRVAQEAARAEREASGKTSFAGRFAGYAARRMLWSAGAYAVSLPGRLAAGLGVDPQDLSGLMAKNVERQNLATDISNVGYIPGAGGQNGVRQSAGAIDAEAMHVAMETGSDPMKLLEGLHKFVGVTGDLKTGREVMRDMARLALATGASMEDMVSAAGEMSARLGDIPDKASVIESTMRHLAGMGLKGAVLPEDVAREMPKLAGLAPQLAGNTADNIAKLFVLLQESRQMGGAGTAGQAATTVRGFMSMSQNAKRVQDFKGLTGMDMRDSNGLLKDPLELITALLKGATDKTTGRVDVTKISKVMGGQRAMGSVIGWLNEDLMKGAEMGGAGGQAKMQAGIDAVAEKFRQLDEATMSRVQIEESVQAKLADTKQQAQLFNNRLQQIVDKAMPELTHALQELGPAVLAAIPAVTKFMRVMLEAVGWIAEKLGLKETPDAAGSESAEIGAEKARKRLLRAPTKENLDAARAELMRDEALAGHNAPLLSKPTVADAAGDAIFGTGVVMSKQADMKNQELLLAAIADLKSTIAKGIPTHEQNPRAFHPPPPITRASPGVQGASREDQF
jgi:hypothetical protein